MDPSYRTMGPPPPPPPSSAAPNVVDQDFQHAYKQLKRRYADLEHGFNAMRIDYERATEQNRRLSQERDMLLDRIIEMRAPASPARTPGDLSRDPSDPYASRGRTMSSSRANRDSILRRALEEDSDEDLHPASRRYTNGADQNGSRHYPPSDRERYYPHPGSPSGPYSPEITYSPYGHSQLPPGQYPPHSHPGSAPNDPYYSRSRSPPPGFAPAHFPTRSPPTDAYPSSHKRGFEGDDDPARKRIRTTQLSPSPPPTASGRGTSRGRGGRSSRARGSVAPSEPRKRKGRGSKAGAEGTPSPEDMENGSGYATPVAPPSLQGRDRSPAIPPPSMPSAVRGGSTPPRPAYSPAPPAPPPSGPPPRERAPSNLPPPPPPPLAPPRPRSTKPKRLKAHTVQSKSYSIPTVPRNPDGTPQLPLNVGIMTVKCLGRVCLDKHFHTERYIFPVGYEVTRRYFSMHDPTTEAQYTCTILHGEDVDGGTGPRFRITASDDPENPITAGTATGAWSVIVKAANKIRNRQHSNSVSGPDYFGLGQNTIKHLLQELEHAELLQDYVRQHFVEGGPLGGRHAAVTAAVNLDDKPPPRPSIPPLPKIPTIPTIPTHASSSTSTSSWAHERDLDRDQKPVIHHTPALPPPPPQPTYSKDSSPADNSRPSRSASVSANGDEIETSYVRGSRPGTATGTSSEERTPPATSGQDREENRLPPIQSFQERKPSSPHSRSPVDGRPPSSSSQQSMPSGMRGLINPSDSGYGPSRGQGSPNGSANGAEERMDTA